MSKVHVMWDDMDRTFTMDDTNISIDALFDSFDYVSVTKSYDGTKRYTIAIDCEYVAFQSKAIFELLWELCKN